MEAEARQITITYLNMQQEDLKNIMIAEAITDVSAQKIKALKRMEIEHTEKTPMASWIKHLSEINDLPYTVPAHIDLVDAIQEDIQALRFMFWIA